MSGATVDKKKGVLELTKLEYQKKWYFPTYFANSVFGPNISKIDANGPFWPKKLHVSNSSFKLIPYPYCRLAVLIVLAIIGEKILVQNPETFFPLFPFLLVFSENQFSNSCLAFLLLLFK